MANDKVAIWNQTIKLGRSPANGELLIGNGADFNLANITAGSGASVSNTAGGIQISATGSGGTLTSVAVSGGTTGLTTSGGPLTTSGTITIAGTLIVANGGTGLTTLTANNVILGAGTSTPTFVAPGTSGNVLTSNGTTWTSAAPPSTWTQVVKTTDQTVVGDTFADDNQLTFTIDSTSATYEFRFVVFTNSTVTGWKVAVNGPTLTTLRVGPTTNLVTVGEYNTTIAGNASVGTNQTMLYGIIKTSATGAFKLRIAQWATNATPTTFLANSYLEYRVLA
jgi:hypothetical protein